MDLTNCRTIKDLLKKHGITPTKRLGQNFLVSRTVLEKFIDAADISNDDIVLEVGAGIGTITVELAKRAKRIIAVEKDPHLIKLLRETCKEYNIKIAEEDARRMITKLYSYKALKLYSSKNGYHLVGNLPFYLTNYLIRKFLESDSPPKDMTVIVQKEVAQRICAKPPRMNLLAISVQYYGSPKIISYVSKKSFWPEPEVDAAILTITQIHTKQNTEPHKFFKMVRAGFAHPRKYLVSNLSKKLLVPKNVVENVLLQNKINLRARAENLSVEDWITISSEISKLDRSLATIKKTYCQTPSV